jgi:hypothetical protein
VLFAAHWSTASYAHGADANTGDIRLAGDTAYVVVWPGSVTFSQFDDNRDGLMQKAETRAHRDAILAEFRQRFVLQDQAGRRGETIFEDVSTPGAVGWPGSRPGGASHLRVTLRIRWATPPRWLVLQYLPPRDQPLRVRSARVTAAKALQEQKLLAPPESVTFDRGHQRHVLLRSSAPPD